MTRSTGLALAILITLGSAGTVAAQQRMVKPNTPLTPEQNAALEAIRDVRDSVVLASSLMAGLQRDIEQKPAATLEEQARRISAQCSVAERQRVASRKQLAEVKFTERDMIKGQKDMLASMDQLRKPLASCQSTWIPLGKAGKGEEVRGYGISRSRPIVAGLDDFERRVVALSKDMKLPVREVLRAGPGPMDAPAPVRARKTT